MAENGHDYTAIGTGVAGFFATIGAWWAARRTAKPPQPDRRENDRHTRAELESISRKLEAMHESNEKRFDKLENRIHDEVSLLHNRINDVSEKAATLAGRMDK